MAVIVSAPSLSTSISYDFRYDLMDPAHPAYWYAFQFNSPDTKDPSTGGYFGLQTAAINNNYKPSGSNLGVSDARFSIFGSDASNPKVGTGGGYDLSADGGSGVSTAIPYNPIQGNTYHIDINLMNGVMSAYVTDISTGIKSFVSSIDTPHVQGFDAGFLWWEQFSQVTDPSQISSSKATFSNIKFDNNIAQFQVFDPVTIIYGIKIPYLESVLIRYETSYTIISGSNKKDIFTLLDKGGDIYLDAGSYTVNGGAGVDTVHLQGNQNEYTVTNNSGVITVKDNVANRGGTDTLTNIEWLNFKDAAVYQGATQTIKNGFANNTYEFVSGYYTYDQALSLASQHIQNGIRGHLITIESAAEEQYIKSLGQWTWIAASDATTETHWLYTAGPNTGLAITYRDWLTGEPNGGTAENYLSMWKINNTFGWVDVPSTNYLGFYVEYEDTKNTSNHAPTVINPIADQKATKGNAFNLTISPNTFLDQDSGDSLSYSATKSDGSALPTWLNFNPATMTFSGTPGSNDIGALALKVTATDKSSASVSDPFNITVSDGTGSNLKDGFTNNTYEYVSGNYTYDQALALASQHIQNGVRGHLITIESAAEEQYIKSLGQWTWIASSDVSSEGHWTFTAGPNTGLALNYLDWLPGEPNGGTTENYLSMWKINNTFGWVDVPPSDQFGFYVEYEDAKNTSNHAPIVANPIADQTANKGKLFNFTVGSNVFTDQDPGDTLTYTASKADGTAIPSWLKFDQSTKTFYGTPSGSDVGILQIKVTATDSHNSAVFDPFNISVLDTTANGVFTTPTNPMITAAPNGSTLAAINGVDLVSKAYGGYYDSNNKIHGFISSEWGFITVDVPFASTEPSKGTTVTALPASDLIWGNYRDNLGTSHGFVEYQSKYYQMDNPAGTYGTWINAANNTQAAGAYCDVMGKLHGYIETFTTTGAEFTTVDAPGGSRGTWICGLSYDGRATGFYIDASNFYHGFVYQSGNYSKLDFSTAIHTIPTGINSDGKVVGTYMDSTGWHGFSYANGNYATYDYPNATLTALTNINNFDVVSGIATVGGSNTSFATHFLG